MAVAGPADERLRPGRFGQGRWPSIAGLRQLRRENRLRRAGPVCGGKADVPVAVGAAGQGGAAVCAVLPAELLLDVAGAVDGGDHGGASVPAVLAATPVEPLLLDHEAGSSVTTELLWLALKTNGMIATIKSTSPTPKTSLIDSAWLIMRPSGLFSRISPGVSLVKIGNLGKKIPSVLLGVSGRAMGRSLGLFFMARSVLG